MIPSMRPGEDGTVELSKRLPRAVPAIRALCVLAAVALAGTEEGRGSQDQSPAAALSASGARWSGQGIFGKGVLYAHPAAPRYTVYAQRRDKDGTIEVHQQDTDLIFFMDGSATFVTGGTVVDERTIRPNELSGSDVRGGVERQVSRGDVFIVPKGTVHWFKKISASISYYVVKVHEPDAPFPNPRSALYWSRADAFAKGGLLYDGKEAHKYQVYAVKRDGPGAPEVHAKETDIVFFLDGAGTWVVGGTATAGKTLVGGEPRAVAKDDAVIVPNGLQHWFRDVHGTIAYYAVKVY